MASPGLGTPESFNEALLLLLLLLLFFFAMLLLFCSRSRTEEEEEEKEEQTTRTNERNARTTRCLLKDVKIDRRPPIKRGVAKRREEDEKKTDLSFFIFFLQIKKAKAKERGGGQHKFVSIRDLGFRV